MNFYCLSIIILLLNSSILFGQEEGRFQGFKSAILKRQKIKKYSSIVFYSKEFLETKGKIKGVGIFNNEIYKLMVYYRRDSSCVHFRRINKTRLKSTLFKCNYQELKGLNNDSLNLIINHKTNLGVMVSGGETYSIYYFDLINNKEILKESYMPLFYQERYPTLDRLKFISIYTYLNSL